MKKCVTEQPTRLLFILYTASTDHVSVQPGTWGARFFRDHVDDGQWGPSSSYWMVPAHVFSGHQEK